MRLLELSLVPDSGEIHPRFPLMSGVAASDIDRSWMLDWYVLRPEPTIPLVRVRGDPGTLRTSLDEESVVREFEVTAVAGEPTCYATISTVTTETERRRFRAFNRTRSLLVPPLKYAEGRVTCRILGHDAELRAAVEAVPDGIRASIDRLGTCDRPPREVAVDLTDRQQALVRGAMDIGYYEVPREATAADVAKVVGCSPSTASEHLRKAEARLIRAVFGD